VAWISEGSAERLITKKQSHEQIKNYKLFTHDVPLYTTPPQRTWVGLTNEEMQTVVDAQPLVSNINVYFRAIEAKLKEKNT
jgi:hypothetical protein